MGKAARFLGKALTGASEVAVPAALETRRARIQTMRDDRLQGFAEKNMANQQAYTSGENKLNRDQLAEQHSERIGVQLGGQEIQREGQEIQREGQEIQREGQQNQLEWQGMQFMANDEDRRLRRQELESTLQTAGLQRELVGKQLKSATDMQNALDTVLNSGATEEAKQAAIEYINLAAPASRDKVIIKQLRGELGEYLDDFAIFNGTTGERVDAAAAVSSPDAKYDTPEKIRAAFKDGLINRQRANQLNDSLVGK